MLKLLIVEVGEYKAKCYLVYEEVSKKCLIIDPGDESEAITEEIRINKLKPIGIALTHGHFDHVMALTDLKLIFDVPVYASSKDKFLLKRVNKSAKYFLKRKIKIPIIDEIEVDLDDTKNLAIGTEIFEVIKTPGHTPGSVCFYHKKLRWLLSGDTLFKGLRGRTDLSYGSTEKIFVSLHDLMKLPTDTVVYPGHGEETTIGKERNKYLGKK